MTLQPQYSLLAREIEWEIAPAAIDAASDPHPTDYPYGELGIEQRARTLPLKL